MLVIFGGSKRQQHAYIGLFKVFFIVLKANFVETKTKLHLDLRYDEAWDIRKRHVKTSHNYSTGFRRILHTAALSL